MGSKLGWLPVDGASADFPYSGIPPIAGLCGVYGLTIVIVCYLLSSSFHFLIRREGQREGKEAGPCIIVGGGRARTHLFEQKGFSFSQKIAYEKYIERALILSSCIFFRFVNDNF